MTVSRWRKHLKEDEHYAEAQAKAQDRVVKLAEFTLHQGTKSDSTEDPEWYTPEKYLAIVHEFLEDIL
jgi:hypothetical protein